MKKKSGNTVIKAIVWLLAVLCTTLSARAQIITAGELIVDMDNADLAAGVTNWINNATSSNSVGDFAEAGNGALAVVPAVTDASNVVANAIYVNGIADNILYSETNAPASLLGNLPHSAEAWIYANELNNESCYVGWGNPGSSTNHTARDHRYGSNRMLSTWFNDANWSGAQPVGRWVYTCVTWDGANVTGYIDGQPDAAQPMLTLNTTDNTIRIGGGAAGRPFRGYVADVRVHTGVLSASEVLNNYMEGMTPPADLSPTIVDLDDVTVFEGVNVIFEPIIAGGEPITKQWLLNGTEIAGETNSTLTLTGVTLSMNSNVYTVVANNAWGAATNSAVLTVNPILVFDPVPFNVDFNNWQNITYTGEAIPEGAGTHWVGVNSSALLVGVTDGFGTLRESVTLWARQANGLYNGFNDAVKGDPKPLDLMSDYMFKDSTITLANIPNAEYDLYVYAHGNRTPQDIGTVTVGDSTQTQVESSTNDFRNITNGENYLLFPVAITSGYLEFSGQPINGFQLVPALPAIGGVADMTVEVLTNLVINAGASGRAPLTYVWSFNGVAISGETGPTLDLGAVDFSDAGEYTVVVANSLGSATNSFTLTVDPGQAIVIESVNVAGATAAISWTADAGPAFNIESSSDLVHGGWSVLTNVISAGSQTNTVPANGGNVEFFRISR